MKESSIDYYYLKDPKNLSFDWTAAFEVGGGKISTKVFMTANKTFITVKKYLKTICVEFGCRDDMGALEWWEKEKVTNDNKKGGFASWTSL